MSSNRRQNTNMTERVELSEAAAVLTKVTVSDMQIQLQHRLTSASCFTWPQRACAFRKVRLLQSEFWATSFCAEFLCWRTFSCVESWSSMFSQSDQTTVMTLATNQSADKRWMLHRLVLKLDGCHQPEVCECAALSAPIFVSSDPSEPEQKVSEKTQISF